MKIARNSQILQRNAVNEGCTLLPNRTKESCQWRLHGTPKYYKDKILIINKDCTLLTKGLVMSLPNVISPALEVIRISFFPVLPPSFPLGVSSVLWFSFSIVSTYSVTHTHAHTQRSTFTAELYSTRVFSTPCSTVTIQISRTSTTQHKTVPAVSLFCTTCFFLCHSTHCWYASASAAQ